MSLSDTEKQLRKEHVQNQSSNSGDRQKGRRTDIQDLNKQAIQKENKVKSLE